MPSDPIDIVKSTLLDTIGAFDAPMAFSDALRIPLIQPGKILAGADRPLWIRVVLGACASAGGDSTIGAHVAASVELFMASLDLLDEIEDGDFSPTVEAVGIPQALNVATTLLLLSQRTLLNLPERENLPAPADFVRTLLDGGLTATVGQHRDLAAEHANERSLDEALAIARSKSGALAGCACRLGAMVGTADPELLDLYERWGVHYGTSAQLGNDLHDAVEPNRKSDISRNKSTLPLIFGASTPDGDIVASGALHFTWVVVEMERQTCRELLEQFAAQGQQIAPFQALVS